MPLSQLKIQHAKPKEKPYKLGDSGGLFLLITPTGSKLWRFKYRFLNKERLLTIGKYPDLSLAEARDIRDDARKLNAKGIDPNEHKKEQRKIAYKLLQLKLSRGTKNIVMTNQQKFALAVTSIFVLLGIGYEGTKFIAGLPSTSAQTAPHAPTTAQQAELAVANIKNQREGLDAIAKKTDFGGIDISYTLAEFNRVAQNLENLRSYKAALTLEEVAYIKQVEAKLINVQKRVLPLLRRTRAKDIGEERWKDNEYVRTYGTGNSTIQFICYHYVLNRTIEESQDRMEDSLMQLRFKKASYKQSEHHGGGTYTLETPADDKIAVYADGKFRIIVPLR